MRNRLLVIFTVIGIILLLTYSCTTNQLVIKSVSDKPSFERGFSVLTNDSSLHFPIGIAPNHESINSFVYSKVAAHKPIDSLICTEIIKHGFECDIVKKGEQIEQNKYIVLYQDYWSWDFKQYMHILKVWVYYNNKEIIKVVSEGNTAGMHDFPTPENQVPKLVDLIMKQQ